jgi:hypothetical protein
MRIINNMAVLDHVWSGPHQLADLVAFDQRYRNELRATMLRLIISLNL